MTDVLLVKQPDGQETYVNLDYCRQVIFRVKKGEFSEFEMASLWLEDGNIIDIKEPATILVLRAYLRESLQKVYGHWEVQA